MENVQRKRQKTAVQCFKVLSTKGRKKITTDIKVFRMTISRGLKKRGLKRRLAAKKPLLRYPGAQTLDCRCLE